MPHGRHVQASVRRRMEQRYYVHGLPGSGAELALAWQGARPKVIAPNDLDAIPPREPAHIIAFSLGAMTALRLAAKHPGRVERLTLIAPAAPLTLGEFLPDMAGRPVFEAAKAGGARLSLMIGMQRLALRLFPGAFLKMLFAGSPEADKALAAEEDNRRILIQSYREALGPGRAAYRAALLHYVSDWENVLEDVNCPLTIHQGTADTWVLPQMSEALAARLPKADITWHEGLGHYGALLAVLSEQSSKTKTRRANAQRAKT